jgi:hypothetical protein
MTDGTRFRRGDEARIGDHSAWPPERPFGWEILDDSGEITRSLETFAARDEAIADGQRTLESDLNL